MTQVNAGKARYAIVTSYPPEWYELAKITNQLKGEYALQWGYHFFADCSKRYVPVDGINVPLQGFIKFDVMLFHIQKYEWVVWIDADALITNKTIRLEQFIAKAEKDGKELIIGYDHNAHHTTVIFAKNTQRMRDFLWACNNTGKSLFLTHPWHEMEAMRYFLQTPPYDDKKLYLSVKELCPIYRRAYDKWIPPGVAEEYGWEPGDWTLHLSAMDLEKRVLLAQHFADPANHYKTPDPRRLP